MVTPFDARGEVDYRQARILAQRLLASGSDGLVVSGTTGESPTLSREEKIRLFAELKDAVGQGIIAGTGSYSTRESIELTREAEKAGASAILLVVPYYNKPTQEGLFQHYKAIAENTSLPCLLYNVPGRTVTNLMAETVIRLSQVENIVGVKEASGNLEQIARIIQETPDDFLVYSGNDADTLPIMLLGGYGVISVASHLVGERIREMMDRFDAGDIGEAAEIHRRLLSLFSALFVVANPVPIKHALNYLGFSVGSPRLPLVEADETSKRAVESAVKAHSVSFQSA